MNFSQFQVHNQGKSGEHTFNLHYPYSQILSPLITFTLFTFFIISISMQLLRFNDFQVL